MGAEARSKSPCFDIPSFCVRSSLLQLYIGEYIHFQKVAVCAAQSFEIDLSLWTSYAQVTFHYTALLFANSLSVEVIMQADKI
jgi:hypothetical protein